MICQCILWQLWDADTVSDGEEFVLQKFSTLLMLMFGWKTDMLVWLFFTLDIQDVLDSSDEEVICNVLIY